MNSRVKRTILAGLISPFAVFPAFFVLILLDAAARNASFEDVIVETFLGGTIVLFIVFVLTLAVGIPAYRRLEAVGRNTWFACGSIGVVLGLLGAFPFWGMMQRNPFLLVLACGGGAAVGLSFRAIAGPGATGDEVDPGAA